jgi:hypothetical protein
MDAAGFDAALAAPGDAAAPLAALHALARDGVGVTLFTVTLIDLAAELARRAYTSHPQDYPVSGTKPLIRSAWFEAVAAGRPFRANALADMLADFPDHATIAALGCGAVINLPVILGGELVATVNLLDAEGRYPAAAGTRAARLLSLPGKAAVAEHLRRNHFKIAS